MNDSWSLIALETMRLLVLIFIFFEAEKSFKVLASDKNSSESDFK